MYRLPKLGRLLVVEDFAPHVGAAFRVDATPAAVDLRLERIDRYPPNALDLREPFTLIFSTPVSALLVAATYRMRAPDGREVAIDLIPTQSAPGERRLYHAVFT